jgi:hypothetical protein
MMSYFKQLLIFVLLFATTSSYSFELNTGTTEDIIYNQMITPHKNTCEIYQSLTQDIENKYIIVAKRGCCSHHGGVCGCKGGRQLCCDGSLSPTCRC